jgi:hypothetical protein
MPYDSSTLWQRNSEVPDVRFSWSPLLVDLRRELCPTARWEKRQRRWLMNDADATTFLRAAHVQLDFARSKAEITIDEATWVVGFLQGAPYRASSA